MQSRRNFIGHVATGIAGTLATSNVLGASDRIRIGIIGPGARGSEILREALACENVECIGAADVYTKRLEEAKAIAPNARASAKIVSAPHWYSRRCALPASPVAQSRR